MKFLGVIAGVLLVAISAANAQESPIKARKDIMATFARQFYGVLGRTQRGQLPYEQAKIDASFQSLAAEGPKLATLFPPNSLPTEKSDYDASPKIWENKADFEAKLASFVKSVGDPRGKVKDIATLKAAYAAINDTCNNCHELYRVKNR